MRLDCGSSPARHEGAAVASRAADVAPAPLVSRWLPLLIALSVLAATLGLWRALLAQERAQIAGTVTLQLETVRNEIATRMESRILALVRMARRWELRGQPAREEWESDAQLYVQHYAGYLAIAWVDASLEPRWLVRPAAARARADMTALLRASRPARRAATLTPAIEAGSGEAVFLLYAPIHSARGFAGFIVGAFQVQPLFDELLREHIAPGYAVALSQAGRPIYRRGPMLTPGLAPWSREGSIALENVAWEARVWPLPEVLAAARSPLPRAVLVGGGILALLLALPVRLAQVARARARETEVANRELEKQMSQRRAAQERLRKLSQAVEQSPNPVIITDTESVIEYVNPRFTQLTGYAADEVIGRTPSILKSGETPRAEYERLWQTIRAGGEWRGLLHNRKKNGELYWEYTAISPIRDGEGRITHFLAVKEDVTERKRLEQKVEARDRELAEAQGLAVVGRMANMVAHDLRNPLSSIKMALQILGRRSARKNRVDATVAEAAELKQIALDQVRYMEEILTDLLQFSRPDALKPDWLNVDKLLDITIAGNERAIQERGARVLTEYQPHLPMIHGDATKLRQVFTNLIVNALQATEGVNRPPEIRVRTSLELEEHLPRVRVDLTDNGIGVDSAQVEKLFEPFYTTRAKGTGLGLAIVKRVVEQHRGSVRLARVPEGGACVTVVLPTAPVQ